MKRLVKIILRATLITLILTIIALVQNLLRKDGLPFIAKKPYKIYTDCPEFQHELSSVSIDELTKGDTVYVDARPKSEYIEGHIPGAINIPYPLLSDYPSEEEIKPLRQIKGKKKIVVYGDGGEGDLGEGLANILKEMGIENVIYLKGGIQAWIKQGKSLEKSFKNEQH